MAAAAAKVSIQIATRFEILMIEDYALFDRIGVVVSDRFRWPSLQNELFSSTFQVARRLPQLRGMTTEELKRRTKALGIATVKFARTLPHDPITTHFAVQLVKSATSVGANYRSACRAKSGPDFISKMTTAEEEDDEALYWFEVLVETETVRKETVATLMDEADQLVRIIVASINTARGGSR